MESLKGKVAIVTGGSRGIGLATARALVAEGVQVAVTGRDEHHLSAARRKIEAAGLGSVETLQSEPQESLPPREAQAEPQSPPSPRPRMARPDLVLPPPPRAKPPARAWRFGVALMVVLIGVEMAYAYRGPLAQRYPVLRPWLEAVCVKANCTVPWSREEQLLKLEDSELLEVPGKPQEIALGARIRNLAHAAQEYPHLELTLTDITGQAAVRRVLRPTDYLGRPLSQGEVMAPGQELSLQLRLETPRMKATGYELLLFYP